MGSGGFVAVAWRTGNNAVPLVRADSFLVDRAAIVRVFRRASHRDSLMMEQAFLYREFTPAPCATTDSTTDSDSVFPHADGGCWDNRRVRRVAGCSSQ